MAIYIRLLFFGIIGIIDYYFLFIFIIGYKWTRGNDFF